MEDLATQLDQIVEKQKDCALMVQTLGNFRVTREGRELNDKDWGREKAIQLFQFLITIRHRRGLHKEQITDQLWEEADIKAAEQNFKVALHGINKTLEPNRKSRTAARYILRQGHTYQVNMEEIWLDADVIEQYIALGNQAIATDPILAEKAYRAAINLHHGIYLPGRLYEDWSSAERERLQVLALGAMITLGELLVDSNPMEAIRLAQQALILDPTWEDAYRLQMAAYYQKSNRPMAIKTYQQCCKVLDEEFGVSPLPETKKLFTQIRTS